MEGEKYVNKTELMKTKTKDKTRTEITIKTKILRQKFFDN